MYNKKFNSKVNEDLLEELLHRLLNDEEFKKTFSLFLKNGRKIKHLTQQQLANRCDISKQTISNFETQQSTPDVSVFFRILQVLEISLVSYLAFEITEYNQVIGKYGSLFETIIDYNLSEEDCQLLEKIIKRIGEKK